MIKHVQRSTRNRCIYHNSYQNYSETSVATVRLSLQGYVRVCPVVVCIPVDKFTRCLPLYLTVVQFLVCVCGVNFFLLWNCGPMRAMASSFLRFLDHTQRRTTFGRTPLYEWSPRLPDVQHWQQTNVYDPGGIRTHIPSKRAVADLHLRRRWQWHRVWWITEIKSDYVSLMPSVFVIHALWVRHTEMF
jgi:hypothetical protein